MVPLIGIGNPLLDIIMQVPYEALEGFDAEPGTMNLVDWEVSKQLLELPYGKKEVPGGSCSNTLRGVAWLAGNQGTALYMGAIGSDALGRDFNDQLFSEGVISRLAGKEVPTGVSVILVTPDHERTMFTHLGACREFTETDVDFNAIGQSEILYITGYMWDTDNQKCATMKAIEYALAEGIRISFDLADPFVVHRFGDELRNYLPGKLSLLFANSEELSVMTCSGGSEDGQITDEEMLRKAGHLADTVIMKTGAKGCMILNDAEVFTVPGEQVRAVDTTAAGDSFAAGFLYGLLQGKELRSCGTLANRIASRIVTVEGCDYSLLDRKEVLSAGE